MDYLMRVLKEGHGFVHWKEQKYVKLAYGSHSCSPNSDVTTQSKCEEAIAYLGFTRLRPPWVGVANELPWHCSVREVNDPKMFFVGRSSRRAGSRDLAPICTAGPTWREFDG